MISLTDDGVGSASLDAGAGHLGMATMRARAEAEGGTLHIESVPGLGTVVTLTLPTLPALPTVPAVPRTEPTHPVPQSIPVDLDRLTVVVCDDHKHLRGVVKLVLSTIPRFHVIGEASDGATCLERVRDLRPDVLILDVRMPGGGPYLAAAARELNPGMRIVAFSGRQDDETRNAMLAAGADQYVVKTGRLQLLIEAIDQARSTRPTKHTTIGPDTASTNGKS